MEYNITQGNHLVCSKEAKTKIKNFISDETSEGYLLPISKETVIDIPRVDAYLIYIIY